MDGGPNTTSGSPRDQAIILEDLNPGFSPVVAASIADAFDMEALSPGISIPERVPGLSPGLSLINNPIQGGPAPSAFGGAGINLINALAGPTISIAQIGSGSASGGGAPGPTGPAGPAGPPGPAGPAGSGSSIVALQIFTDRTSFDAVGWDTVSTEAGETSLGALTGAVSVGDQSEQGEGIEEYRVQPQIRLGIRDNGSGSDILGLCVDLFNTGLTENWAQVIALQTCATSSAQRAEDDATSGVANVLVDSLGEVLIGTDGNVLLEGSSFNDTWDTIITDTEDILTDASFSVLAVADLSGGVFDTILVDANGDVLTNANASNPEPILESS